MGVFRQRRLIGGFVVMLLCAPHAPPCFPVAARSGPVMFSIRFVIFVTTHTQPRFPWAVCRYCICFFIVRPLVLSVPFLFSRSFCSVVSSFLWRMHFFILSCLFPRIVLLIVRSPGLVCLSLGASGYLGARQSRGPPGRGVAERAARVPANYA